MLNNYVVLSVTFILRRLPTRVYMSLQVYVHLVTFKRLRLLKKTSSSQTCYFAHEHEHPRFSRFLFFPGLSESTILLKFYKSHALFIKKESTNGSQNYKTKHIKLQSTDQNERFFKEN